MKARRLTRAALLAIVIIIAMPVVAGAYLLIGVQVGTQVIALQWKSLPVKYLVTDRNAVGVTAAQLQPAIDASFGAWTQVPTAVLSSQFLGFTSLDPSPASGQTVLGFESHPELPNVLGSTSWEIDAITGAPRAAHIFLNTTFSWSVTTPPTSGRFDVQSVATHEIGHLYGLSHSAIGETEPTGTGGRRVLGKAAVMFPIAFPPGTLFDRTLTPDDIAGISEIYPTTSFGTALGQIAGRVTLGGNGVFGAHVTAFDQRTGNLVGGFTLNNAGNFVISGLTPGLFLVRVEPLDDADLDSFFDTTTTVNINFKPMYFAKLVTVPAGGSSTPIEIKVVSK